jgi:hypothetical protein
MAGVSKDHPYPGIMRVEPADSQLLTVNGASVLHDAALLQH